MEPRTLSLRDEQLRQIAGAAAAAVLVCSCRGDHDASKPGAMRSAPSAEGVARLVLERTDCYGYCPSYSVEVHRDGTVAYEGRAFVRVLGAARWRMPPEKTDALFGKAARARAETWQRRYAVPITDSASAKITIELRSGAAISVEDYPPCHSEADPTPEGLCDLENAIDDMAGTSDYVRCVREDGGLAECRP
jgi:hypothetical protein